MRRTLLAFVAAVLVLVPVAPARADEIAEKQAEARRISLELEEAGRRVSVLAEEYNAARIDAERVEQRLRATEADLAVARRGATRLRERLKAQAVESYVRGGYAPALAMLADTGLEDDLTVRRQYVDTVTGQLGDTLDELRQVRAGLEEQARRLADDRRAASMALAAVEAARREARAAQRSQEQLLATARGEVAELVAAEERRRAESEAQRVQAELAARRSREQAARQTATPATTEPRRPGTASTTTAAPSTTTTTTAPSRGPAAPPPASGAQAAVEEARRQLGKPYEWGGSGPDSFDCSGLTAWAWRAGGKSLPHSSRSQYAATSRVSIADIQPGDLLFYGDPIHHVGIYVGDGQMIEAPETGKNVRYASIYRRDYVGAGRVN